MDFGLSDSQRLLQESIREFLRQEVPMDRVRSVMESESGYDPGIAHELGQLGVTGVLVPEELGGVGLSLLDAAVVAQELGRGATPLSFHSAWVMAPLFLLAAGSEEQRRRWLPDIAQGQALVSFVSGTAGTSGRGETCISSNGRLNGTVPFVPDATVAHAFIVAVGSGSDAPLHLLPRQTEGLTVEALRAVDDTRRVGEVRFADVALGEGTQMPAGGGLIRRIVDAGRIALAADALGTAQQAMRLAVDYSRERRQFGRTIGTFQAVKHMCAEAIASVDPVQSLLWYTAYAWDRRDEESSYLAPLLKSHATEVASEAVNTATQVFGGMGFTYECDVHIWFKRAGYDRQMLGGPAELRQLAASLQFDGGGQGNGPRSV